MPAEGGNSVNALAIRTSFLDIWLNLREVEEWIAKGNRHIAAEKIERIGIVLDKTKWISNFENNVSDLHKSLSNLLKQLEEKDSSASVERELDSVSDAFHHFTHAYYDWLSASEGTTT